MQNIKEILAMPTPYRGGKSAELVREKVRELYGDKAAKEYDPHFTCRSFREWGKINYRVKKGAKAIKSITVIEEKDSKGKVISTYPKVVNLFHIRDVERLKI